MKFSTLKGFRFFTPENYAKYKYLYKKLSEVADLFGYKEIQTPALEKGEVLSLKGGLSPDQMREVFMFQDYGKRWVGLRFDLTTPIAREVAEKYDQYVKKFPLRWYYFSPMWRYERPQKGRYREFWQFGVELMGINSISSNAEILAMLALQLNNLGLKPQLCKIFISSRELSQALFKQYLGEKEMEEVLRILDKKGKVNNKELLDEISKINDSKEVREVSKLILDLEPSKNIEEIKRKVKSMSKSKEVMNILEELEKTLAEARDIVGEELSEYFMIDISIVRGFDYYTGIVFEVFIVKDGKRKGSALAGGGRYDNLIEKYGAREPVPAIGYAFGVDRTIESMEEILGEKAFKELENIVEVHIIVDLKDREIRSKAFELRQFLQSKGIVTTITLKEYDSSKKLLKKELKYADANSIGKVIILDEKIKEGKVIVKDLSQGKQEEIALEDLYDHLLKPQDL